MAAPFDMGRVSAELLEKIFGCLDTCTATMVVPRVCRRWQEVCARVVLGEFDLKWACVSGSTLAWGSPSTTWAAPFGAAGVRSLVGRVAGARRVDASAIEDDTYDANESGGPPGLFMFMTDEMLCCVCELKHITALDLANNFGVITDEGLAHVATLHLLTWLNLGECRRVTDAGMAHVARLERLAFLDVSGVEEITDTGLARVTDCTQLASLSVAGCQWIMDEGVGYLVLLEHLTSLDLAYCGSLTEECLEPLGLMHQLTSLKLRDEQFSGSMNQGLVFLSTLQELVYLDLGSSGQHVASMRMQRCPH